ncbi:MAG: hypothetical protein ACQGVK_24345 [Myxococcota bacterium]
MVPPSGRAERPCERSRHPLVSRDRRPAAALDALLADLGASIRRGAPARSEETRTRLATGLPEVDRLLCGGLPLGRLSEIHGPPSSGRTSLWLSLVAGVTRGGECAAVVDHADAFDPPSARAAGIDLARVLWARAPGRREALRCTERLLETEGFPLVVLDLGAADAGRADQTAWLRLARLAARTRTALVLVGTGDRRAGSHAEVALEMQLERAHFEGTPALLEALSSRAVVVRHRSGPAGSAAPVRWRAFAAA